MGLYLHACLGGEICIIGGKWVVNTSGGLESKGICIQYTVCDPILSILMFYHSAACVS